MKDIRFILRFPPDAKYIPFVGNLQFELFRFELFGIFQRLHSAYVRTLHSERNTKLERRVVRPTEPIDLFVR